MKKLLIGSLILNVLLIVLIAGYLYEKREDIMQKMIERRHKADIVMFGDSHTARANWSILLERTGVKRSGHGGFTSDQLSWLVDQDIIAYKPKLCLIQMGGNDINSQNFSVDTVVSNISRVVHQLQYHDIQPVVQSLFYRPFDPEYNQTVDSINQLLVDFCLLDHIDYLDINAALTASGLDPANYIEDGVHLGSKGYKIWAEQIRNYLEERKL